MWILEIILERSIPEVVVHAEHNIMLNSDFKSVRLDVYARDGLQVNPFGKGLYRYTFEERCLECDMGLGDGTRKIFLNTRGTNREDVLEELVHFLEYMEKSTDTYVAEVTEPSIHQLHKKVKEIKRCQL